MTDIPGTITTAIREAIDAAVTAERERVGREVSQVYDQVYSSIERRLRVANDALLGAKAEMDAAVLAERERCAMVALAEHVNAEETGNAEDVAYNLACEHIAAKIRAIPVEPEGQHFDITAGTFVSNTRG